MYKNIKYAVYIVLMIFTIVFGILFAISIKNTKSLKNEVVELNNIVYKLNYKNQTADVYGYFSENPDVDEDITIIIDSYINYDQKKFRVNDIKQKAFADSMVYTYDENKSNKKVVSKKRIKSLIISNSIDFEKDIFYNTPIKDVSFFYNRIWDMEFKIKDIKQGTLFLNKASSDKEISYDYEYDKSSNNILITNYNSKPNSMEAFSEKYYWRFLRYDVFMFLGLLNNSQDLENISFTIGTDFASDESLYGDEIYIPKNVTVIKEGAFSNKKITHLVLPDEIKKIEKNAFQNENLKKISIPKRDGIEWNGLLDIENLEIEDRS